MSGGRPTKYKNEYNTTEYLQGFFDHCIEKNELVSLCGLSVYIGVCEDTIQEWCSRHPAFSVSAKKIKQVSKNQLCNGGLNKTYNPLMAKFLLSATHNLREKSDVTSNDESINIKIPDKFKAI